MTVRFSSSLNSFNISSCSLSRSRYFLWRFLNSSSSSSLNSFICLCAFFHWSLGCICPSLSRFWLSLSAASAATHTFLFDITNGISFMSEGLPVMSFPSSDSEWEAEIPTRLSISIIFSVSPESQPFTSIASFNSPFSIAPVRPHLICGSVTLETSMSSFARFSRFSKFFFSRFPLSLRSS